MMEYMRTQTLQKPSADIDLVLDSCNPATRGGGQLEEDFDFEPLKQHNHLESYSKVIHDELKSWSPKYMRPKNASGNPRNCLMNLSRSRLELLLGEVYPYRTINTVLKKQRKNILRT